MNALEISENLNRSGWDKKFTDWELLDLASEMLLKQHNEIQRLRQFAESCIRSEYEGTSMLEEMLKPIYESDIS